MRRIIIIAALIVVPLFVSAQRQQHFRKQLPAGNYSGICAIGNDCFALVDDKAPTDGFRLVRILFDADGQRISSLEDLGYRSSGLPNRDMEGICYRPSTQTLFISGEADNEVYEYTLDGQRTGRRLAMPDNVKRASHNYGLEALTYDAVNHLFFTTTERPLPGDSTLRILAFGDDLKPEAPISISPTRPLAASISMASPRCVPSAMVVCW